MALRDRSVLFNQSAGGGGGTIYQHPFRIVATTVDDDPAITVGPGAATVGKWVVIDSGSSVGGRTTEYTVASLGPTKVSVETLYGVWVVADTTIQTGSQLTNGATLKTMGISTFAVVISDSAVSEVNATGFTTSGDHANKMAWFLGSVDVSAEGVIDITQYRKSDIAIAEPVWFIPRIVSADTPNDISVGTDGGAKYVDS
jgi:hypothetical protein